MDELKMLVINTALKDMLRKGYMDICCIRKILEINGAIPNGDDLRLLEALHCVAFKDMPPALLHGLPVLIQRVVGSEGIELDYKRFGSQSSFSSLIVQ